MVQIRVIAFRSSITHEPPNQSYSFLRAFRFLLAADFPNDFKFLTFAIMLKMSSCVSCADTELSLTNGPEKT